MGDEIFYKLSDGIKALDMFKSTPKTEENVTSDVTFGNSFVEKSPFSTFMIILNNTETFGPADKACNDEIECFFDDRKNIEYLKFNFTLSYYDAVFPDQNTVNKSTTKIENCFFRMQILRNIFIISDIFHPLRRYKIYPLSARILQKVFHQMAQVSPYYSNFTVHSGI